MSPTLELGVIAGSIRIIGEILLILSFSLDVPQTATVLNWKTGETVLVSASRFLRNDEPH